MSESQADLSLIDLPADGRRPDRSNGARATVTRRLPDDLVAAAAGYARARGVALSAVSRAALATVRRRYAADADPGAGPRFADLVARYDGGADGDAVFHIASARTGADVVVRPGAAHLTVEHPADLADDCAVERLLDHVVAALAGGLADPDRAVDDIDILAPGEHDQVLYAWNPPPAQRPAGRLHDVLAGHHPEHVAIRFQGAELTYGQLEAQSNRLAHALQAVRVGTGDVVGLLLHRGAHLTVAELGVMKAGAAWLPLDPQHPPARLSYLATDGQARLILTTGDLTDLATATAPYTPHWRLDQRTDAGPDAPPVVDVRPEDPAYLLYTSGSTGTPKGVLVPHAGAHHYCRTAVELFHMSQTDRVAQMSNPAFDAHIFDTYATLLAGATLISAPRETFTDPAAFTALIRDEHVTLSYIPPAFLAILDPNQLTAGDLRGAFSAGEALPPDQAARWPRPGFDLHNSYGPTETTVVVTDFRCTPEPLHGPTPIGTALPNHRAYALDQRLRPVPIGVPGQLYIAGPGVTYGYHHQPALTAERFLADPYGPPGSRMYATGDLVRRRPDGLLEFLGRRDRQVQLRGQRVELGEIEHALTQHPDIHQVAVLVHDGNLVAYLAGEPNPDDVRTFLADRLPTYMIPTSYITLPALPLTPNGKLDTARLPGSGPTVAYREPATRTERWLADAWRDLLGVDRVGADDSFFDLGGDSLQVTQLITRIRTELDRRLRQRDVFTHSTLDRLAACVDRAEPVTVGQPIVPVPRDGSMVCTYQQEGLWFEHQLDPASTAYHIGLQLRLRGALNLAALARSLHALLVRHEALRTRFVERDGLPRQVVDLPPAAPGRLPIVDIDEDRIDGWIAGEVGRPMDLTDGPLFRAPLARVAADDHVLLLLFHHVVADGWSMRVLSDELSELYAGETMGTAAALPNLPVQPADHAAWQRGWFTDHELDRQLDHWRAELADLPTVDLPTDRPRPAQPTGAGALTWRRLPDDLAAAARAYARANRVSFLALLHAAYATVLHRYTGQADLPIGSIFSGRARAEVEPMVGYFANTLVLRTCLDDGPSFAELVDRCHGTVVEATAHQDVPFTLVVDALRPERVPGRNPLFQTSLSLHPPGATFGGLGLGAASVEETDVGTGYARFDLAIVVVDEPDGRLNLSVEYSTELFDADRIERLVDHFTTALGSGLAAPRTPVPEIDVLTGAERDLVLRAWNPPATPYEPGLLHTVTAGHDPTGIAVRHRGTELTYGELETRSNRLAHALRDHGVRTGDIIGLLLDRGPHLTVAELAVMKAGAAWLPLDPQHPPARLGFMADDAGVRLILTTSDLANLAPAGPTSWRLDEPAPDGPDTPPAVDVRPEDAAYLIYTSGSTGDPKGVLVSHRSAHAYSHNARDQFHTTAADRVALTSNPAFDAHVFDTYPSLLAGATLVSAPRETFGAPEAFTELIRDERVTLSFIPPAVLAMLDPDRLRDSALSRIATGGDVLPAEQVRRWSRPGLELHNPYGPTETTVVVVDYVCPVEPVTGPPPIGTPLPCHRAYVLDARLRPAPVGVPGQLHIAGPGVAHGYLHRPGLTAERFLADPYGSPGDRMYATGDLARWRADGLLEYLGRSDRQVQLRGQRVELGEIEHTLVRHPDVRQCAVLLRAGDHLVAYLVGEPDLDDVRRYLADRLPTYMIPTGYVTLPALPLTPNGKLDTARLPDPAQHLAGAYVEPRTATERWLADTWQNLLQVDRVGATDNFFDLGGNSLHVTQLGARIRDRFGIRLHPRRLFADSVLDRLAARVDRAEAAARAPIAPAPRGRALPCTYQQEGLWFEHQVDPSSAVYHIGLAVRLHGPVDVAALGRAVHAGVVRHESLRTRFVAEDGRPRQVVDPPPPMAPLSITDIAAERADEWIAGEVLRPMDLARGPLFRATMARLAADEHVLLLVVHHIVADGWSARVLADELSQLYAAETGAGPVSLPELPIQPADHAAWQRGRTAGDDLDRQLDHWRTALAELPTVDLPADRPRPARPTGAGATLVRRLPDELTRTAREYARTRRVSFLAVLQAALATVLHRYTGQTDLPIGSIFSGRTRAEIEPLVGYFANTLVLRTDAGGNPSFAELVDRCHQSVLDATAHQEAPFTLVVDALRPERVAGRNPLFQVSLSLYPPGATLDALALDRATADAVDVGTGFARFDLGLAVVDEAEGRLDLQVEYSTELFDADRMERLADHFTAALAGGLADPRTAVADLDILPPAERDRVLRAWNPPATPYEPGRLHDVVAGHDPGRVAIRCQGTELTYGELVSRSNRLAHALRDAGIGVGQVVGLLLEPGLDLPVAQLAVMACGAAWTILDPQLPPARLALQTGDAAVPLVLTTTGLSGLAPTGTPCWRLDDPDRRARIDAAPDTPVPADVRPDDPAYLLYTSGSTGTPKGVLVAHRSAHHYCLSATRLFGTTPADRVVQVANPAFDASIFDCFATLLAGATLIGAPRETIADPSALTALLRDERVTLAYLPPALLAALDPAEVAGNGLRALFSAGEALPAEQANRWSRARGSGPGLEVHNSFGPTETTVVVTDYLCPGTPLPGGTPIGTALANHRAYVLDERLRPAPVGVPGQLYIGGIGVSYGYLHRPALTAESFVAELYGPPGDRMYATGDLARWRADGVLEFLGRTDRQVKLRGQRVELGEIEHALAGHPRVRHGAVVLSGGRLTAYVVGDADPDELRTHLADRLPVYMIPTVFVPLPALPLTASGKLDRTRLPKPDVAVPAYVAPRTPTERWLAGAWQEILGAVRLGATDNFFDVGGNSLQVTQLITRIRTELGRQLRPRDVFTNSTLDQLAAYVDRVGPVAAEEPVEEPEEELDEEIAELERLLAERAEMERRLAEKRAAKSRRTTSRRRLVPVPRDSSLVCAYQQEGMWLEHQMDPLSTENHIVMAVRLRGALDVPALERALHALVVRHEALRTRFVDEDGLPRQVVDPPPDTRPLPVDDLAGREAEQWLTGEVRRPIDLATGPLFRTPIARIAPDEHVLVLVVHHIVADGWSIRVLSEELSRLYAAETGGTEARLPDLPIQPADHAVWQRGWFTGEELDRELDYWRTALADLPTVDFPADRPRPAQPTGAGASQHRRLPDDLAHTAREYARTRRVSFLAVIHAALVTALHRHTGQTDLPIGSIFSGRARSEIEPLVGYFVNGVILRTRLDGDPSFAALVDHCHDTVLEATAHQEVPFSLVVEALNPERVPGRNPLFQFTLIWQPASTSLGLTLDGVTVEPMLVSSEYAGFDLTIVAMDQPDGGLSLALEYSTELFDADRIERFVEHMTAALAGGLADPDAPVGDIEIPTAAERDLVLNGWNPAPVPRTPGLLHDVLAGHDPQAVAIRFEGAELTYGELEARANRLAHALRDGIGPGQIVGLLLNRGPQLTVAELAVMKAGAAWLQLDPQHPATRLGFMVGDAGARLVLTTTDLAELAATAAPAAPQWSLDALSPTGPDTPPEVDVRPEDPAYLLYTSGSTGTPKGVLVPHSSARSYCQTAVEMYGTTPVDRVAQASNPAFDAHIFDTYATLLAGATLVSAPRETFADPDAFTELICAERVSLSFIAPAVLALLDPARLADSPLRGIFSAGEALPPEQAARWSRPGLELHNSYGPTETTVVVTDYLCTPEPLDGPTPIGTALPNHRAYALDQRLRPVPIGVPGQLYVAGAGVTYGYHRRPGLTATRFLPDPYGPPGSRMYATGDLVRWRADGLLEFIGRRDRQVQLRGQRVELGEIEHTLQEHPGIRQCAVALHRGALAGYLVGDADLDDVRRFLVDRLPTYMIPATYVTLPALPLSPNGKLDTARLPDPAPPAARYVAPCTATERWLAEAWQDLLQVDRVGVHDVFFDLGATSLHTTQLAARVRRHLGVHLHPRRLFANPTLEQLAAELDRMAGEHTGQADALVPLHAGGTREPLFLVHPVGGAVTHYLPLAAMLGDDRPVYAIEDPELHGAAPADSLTERARRYVSLIRKVQPHGPYHLGGWSLGGVVAMEMAQQLTDAGESVAVVLALDSGLPVPRRSPTDLEMLSWFVLDVAGTAGARLPDVDVDALRGLDRNTLEDLAVQVLEQAGLAPADTQDDLRTRMRVFAGNIQHYAAHTPRPYAGRLVLVNARDNDKTADMSGWKARSPRLEHLTVSGDHYTMLREPHLRELAEVLRRCLDADAAPTPR